MEKLQERVYIIPIREKDTSFLRQDDVKFLLRKETGRLPGLNAVSEKRLHVHAVGINGASENPEPNAEEPEEWVLGKHRSDHASGVIVFIAGTVFGITFVKGKPVSQYRKTGG